MAARGVKDLSWPLRVAAAAYQLTFLALMAGLFVSALGYRAGAYIALAGFVGYYSVHRVFVLAGSRETNSRLWPHLGRIRDRELEWAYGILLVVLIGGVFLAIVGERLGAYLMLIAFTAQLATDFAVAVKAYQLTMSRPWPQVAPIEDDDDW